MARLPLLAAPIALWTLGFGAACVFAPDAKDWLAVGFRSPEQAFQSFQTAVRADSPELEYRCFSVGFRRRNGISKLTWREVREELRARYPWLRLGVADAEMQGIDRRRRDRAELVVVSHGQSISIGLVREDFAELWAGAEPVYDESIEFAAHAGVQQTSAGKDWFYVSVELPRGDARAADVTELHAGREWKIDSIAGLDALTPP